MCILRLSSNENSFKAILEHTNFQLFSIFDAGEYRDTKRTRVCKTNQATVHISSKEWDDVEGQIQDVISFFENNKNDLKSLFKLVKDLNAHLDFPILSKFDGKIVTQGITFPSQLTTLAGYLNIGIGMTLYEHDFFKQDC